jgi:uncharacterized protein (DUF427 family)
MQALWNGQVIAEADKEDLIYIERNWYFPPDSVNHDFLRMSNTPYTCPWKGVCQYFDVGDPSLDQWSKDAAFTYPSPKESAIDTVKKDFSNYFAFWRDVEIKE